VVFRRPLKEKDYLIFFLADKGQKEITVVQAKTAILECTEMADG